MAADPAQAAPPTAPTDQRAVVCDDLASLVLAQLHRFAARDDARVRTHLIGDLLVVVIDQPLTPYEARVVDRGGADHVREARGRFHQQMRGPLVTGVEARVGRRVLAFLSDDHLDPDVSVQTFVLAPDE